tara:strand:+ start:4037 stop:4822 length:786 start_codon:yes stop_codon:yes gene_type:complete
VSISDWFQKYQSGTPITLLTAYDAAFARLLEMADIDGILVGDSLRHTFYGDTTTVTATMAEMLYHTKAVRNGAKNAFIIADMPFMSYHTSIEESLKNASQFIQAGANAVKCETRAIHVSTIDRMIKEGIPVMAHIGLQPQYLNESGSYNVQGKTDDQQKQLLDLATSLADVGTFSIVLEKLASSVAKKITTQINCPTIGIGAGPHCSGQVLVTNDLLGLTPNFKPKFLKQYLDGEQLILNALKSFKTEVETNQFPTSDHGY